MTVTGLNITDGQLHPIEELEDIILPQNVPVLIDGKVTLSHGNTEDPDTDDLVGAVLKFHNGNALVVIDSGAELILSQYYYGEFTEIDSVSYGPAVEDTEYWIVAEIAGSTVLASVWDEDPDDGGDPLDEISHTMNFGQNLTFGPNISGRFGFYIKAESAVLETMWIDNFDISTQSVPSSQVTVFNLGNYRAKSIITLVGPIVAPFEVKNNANGQVFSYTVDVEEGDQLIINSRTRDITNQGGDPQFAGFEFSSDLIDLEPKQNSLVLTAAEELEEGAGIKSVRFYHTWL